MLKEKCMTMGEKAVTIDNEIFQDFLRVVSVISKKKRLSV
jgi:hypothetical protein